LPTSTQPLSAPDVDPAQPVSVLTGDGTYSRSGQLTRLSPQPADQQRLYRAITEDATFPDWYAKQGLTGDLEQYWQDFVLWALDKKRRSDDWDKAFKRWLRKARAIEAERRTAPTAQGPKGKDAILAALKGGTA